MIRLLLPLLFYPSPKYKLSVDETIQFSHWEHMLRNRGTTPNLADPKITRFLFYLSQTGQYVFHGSNDIHITKFEPRDQTLFNGQPTKAVFASSDPNWSIFFAILNRKHLKGGFRNGCLIGKNNKYHFYSLNESTAKNEPWTEGGVYIFPKDQFRMSGDGKLRFDEWICQEPVFPLGMIQVNPSHFCFINKVSIHGEQEAIAKTWSMYKIRTIRKKNQ